MTWRPTSTRWGEPLVAFLSSGLLFWDVSRKSPFIGFDTGPYLSLAHNLEAHGRLVSHFNFVGNFGALPSVPNFIPPGLGIFVAAFLPLTGDLTAAGRAVLFLSLALTQLFATYLLAQRTGDRGYALAVAGLMVWDPRIASLAGRILTELPFVACLLGATLAAASVLRERPAKPWTKWLALPVASALLCLTRYIGVFFPLALSAVYLGRALGGPPPRASRVLAAVGYLAVYGAIAAGPVLLWLAAAWTGGSPLVPARPPSLLPAGTALRDAAVFVGVWAAPWVGAGAIVLAASRVARTRLAEADRRLGATEWLLAAGGLSYVALLVVIRTRIALYPLESLGTRYTMPAWPLAFLLFAILFHRLVWSPGDARVRRLAAGLALLALVGQAAVVLTSKPLRLPFPMETQTYRAAVGLIGERDVVLTAYGQMFCHAKPEARIISAPSTADFNYELDLPALAARHRVRWVIVFDQALGSPPLPWLHADPPGVRVARTWRLADGVIYELGELGEPGEPGQT